MSTYQTHGEDGRKDRELEEFVAEQRQVLSSGEIETLQPDQAAECQEETCFLPADPGEAYCILHVRREGKSKEELLPALEQYAARDILQIQRAYLCNADCSGLTLTLRNFQYSDLTGANFRDARLFRVGFDFSILDQCNFENVIFDRVDLRHVESAKNIAWYRAIFTSIQMPSVDRIGSESVYDSATCRDPEKTVDVYQNLKETYRRQGLFDAAGLFYEQEMDQRRKSATRFSDKLWLFALWLLCGYGERPARVFLTFLVTIGGFGVLYTFFTLIGPSGPIRGDFLQGLYFSVVTFTSLGYGDIRPEGFARFLAGSESLLGIFLISLFVFVFCRKMIR